MRLFCWVSGVFGGVLTVLVVFRLFRWFAGRFCVSPAVSVAFRPFQWVSASLGQLSGHFGDCLALSALFWPFG